MQRTTVLRGSATGTQSMEHFQIYGNLWLRFPLQDDVDLEEPIYSDRKQVSTCLGWRGSRLANHRQKETFYF